jgi:hypothetical protein
LEPQSSRSLPPESLGLRLETLCLAQRFLLDFPGAQKAIPQNMLVGFLILFFVQPKITQGIANARYSYPWVFVYILKG